VELPIVLADTSELIGETSCAGIASTDAETEKSKFTITGRGGLPPNPYDFLSSDVIWTDNRIPTITTQQQASEKPAAKPPSKADAIRLCLLRDGCSTARGMLPSSRMLPMAIIWVLLLLVVCNSEGERAQLR
jgi:hypothetical protein